MVFPVRGNHDAVPWLTAGCENKHETTVEISAFAAKHFLAQISGMVLQGLQQPLQGVRVFCPERERFHSLGFVGRCRLVIFRITTRVPNMIGTSKTQEQKMH